MTNYIQEIFIENSPISISAKNTENILFQMKNCICKIIKDDGNKGTGFFCKIKFKEELLPVLITNNHILNINNLINNNIITFTFNDNKEVRKIKINKERKIYTNKKIDITFIEIKESDKIKNI